MNIQTLKFISDADRASLSLIQRRILRGELHLRDEARRMFVLCGRSARELKRAK